MNIGAWSVERPVVSWLIIVVLVVGGIASYDDMGKLEDPAFTIKQAKILTRYPGASAREVEEELTYHIEDAVQRLPQLKRIKMSVSRPGLSDILIELKDEYRADDLPNVYDELRRKIADVSVRLPPGALKPVIIDDFGDVYGIYFMLSGKGYSWRDLADTAEEIKRQLVLVPGVRKIVIEGEQREVVNIEIARSRLGELGLDINSVAALLGSQNTVVDAGGARADDEFLRISPTGDFDSVQDMGDLLIGTGEGRLIRLRDIASIERAYQDRPDKLFYINGEPALSIGVSMTAGENVVAVGSRIEERMRELLSVVPVGMELQAVYDQPQEVETSVASFLASVAQAVAIVILVLLAFMGLRVGFIIGAILLITVAGTLFIMSLWGIELQRISLGALVIALGMLVDNAIVVAEGMMVRIRRGESALAAAQATVGGTIWALLGGTAIGILAFSAIGLSKDGTGEFAGSLFYVILISLSLSWLTAVSSTPLLCSLLLKPGSGQDGADDSAAYDGRVFRGYRRLLEIALRRRWFTVALAAGLFLAAVVGFGQVKSGFFPASNTPMFFVDVWEPQGTDIRRTRDDILRVSAFLRDQEGVLQTASVVGGAHQRFTLVYDAKAPDPVYGQVVVRVDDRRRIPQLVEAVEGYLRSTLPSVDPITKSLRIGPGRDAKIEARFSGPDAQVLRDLASEATAIMRADPEARDIRDDWRSPEKVVRPVFNEQTARPLGITREDLAEALAYGLEGFRVGVYRDGEDLLPIIARAPAAERANLGALEDLQIWSPVTGESLPVSQVLRGVRVSWENAVLRSRDRKLTITASANPRGELATPLFERLRPQIEAIELPPGYELEWGGEYEDSRDAQAGLLTSLPLGFVAMILTSILLFGRLRQPAIIWLTVPLAIVGITAGLLVTGGAFDFMSLLGGLSLVGLLIKNAIVLIDETDQQIAAGRARLSAVLDSAVSRMRPVALAASTTILGLIPLLSDVFFVNMSITIMAGLGFATLLTLFFVPTLYVILFRIEPGERETQPSGT